MDAGTLTLEDYLNSLSHEDLRTIKEFAMQEFINKSVSIRNPDLFNTKCFLNGLLVFLSQQGYTKIELHQQETE